MVFVYVDTLWRELSKKRGLFDKQMAIRLFGDVCLGVTHLHDVGIVKDLGLSSCAATWVLPNSKSGRLTAVLRS